jgi:SAM-dependent methyltransferase
MSFRRSLGHIMDLVPDRIWLKLIRGRWAVLASRDPAEALRFMMQAQEELNRYIDQGAIRYENGVHVKHRLTKYHDFFVERIRPGERVLDAGCGNGAVSYDVAERSDAHVLGMDLDEENIARARERFPHPRVTYIVGDVLRDLPKEPFDAVILSNVLEHLPHRTEFLQRLKETAAPSRMLIRVPLFERAWEVPLRKELGLEWRSDATHETEYTQESFVEEMDAAQLTLVHQEIRWGEIWAEVK